MATFNPDPLTGQSGPFSLAHQSAAQNVANGNTAPYAPGYLNSVGVQLPSSSPNYPVDGNTAATNNTTTAAQQAAAAQQAQQAQLAAQYADEASQLQGQMGQLDTQQQVGLGNIGNSYNQQANRLADSQGQAQRNYQLQGQQNTQNFSSARNNAMVQTNHQANALQRLLGMNGAGNSSAAYEQAPYAAALAGSQLVNGAQKTYGQNQQSLDTNWQDTTKKFKNSQDDLNNQRYQQENGLRSSIDQNRASLLQQIAQANMNHDMALGSDYQTAAANQSGNRQQVNDLLSQITQLGNQYQNPILKAQDVTYQAPSLSQYNIGDIAAPQQSGAQQGTSDVSPTFLSLLSNNQKRDAYGNLITA